MTREDIAREVEKNYNKMFGMALSITKHRQDAEDAVGFACLYLMERVDEGKLAHVEKPIGYILQGVRSYALKIKSGQGVFGGKGRRKPTSVAPNKIIMMGGVEGLEALETAMAGGKCGGGRRVTAPGTGKDD